MIYYCSLPLTFEQMQKKATQILIFSFVHFCVGKKRIEMLGFCRKPFAEKIANLTGCKF